MNPESWARIFEIVPIGLLSGLLAGAFGVGGGIIAVPLVRHVLGLTAHEAVGSTLAMILPTAVIGVANYLKQGKIVPKISFVCSGPAIIGTVVASAVSHYLNGQILMLMLAALMVVVALDFLTDFGAKLKASAELRDAAKDTNDSAGETTPGDSSSSDGSARDASFASDTTKVSSTTLDQSSIENKTEKKVGESLFAPSTVKLSKKNYAQAALIGIFVGLLSGMLGVGGGFIMVPAFCYFLGLPLKVAFGTSLIVVALVALPGTVVHAMHKHVLPWVVLPMLLGSMPGAWLGSYFSLRAKDRTLRIVFGSILLVMAVAFALKEMNVFS